MTTIKENDISLEIQRAPDHLRSLVAHLQRFYAVEGRELRMSTYLPRDKKGNKTRYSLKGALYSPGNTSPIEQLLLTVSYDSRSMLYKLKERTFIPEHLRRTLLEKLRPQSKVVITKYEYSTPTDTELKEIYGQIKAPTQGENARYLWAGRREKVNSGGLTRLFQGYESDHSEQFLIVGIVHWTPESVETPAQLSTFKLGRNKLSLDLCDHPPHVFVPEHWLSPCLWKR